MVCCTGIVSAKISITVFYCCSLFVCSLFKKWYSNPYQMKLIGKDLKIFLAGKLSYSSLLQYPLESLQLFLNCSSTGSPFLFGVLFFISRSSFLVQHIDSQPLFGDCVGCHLSICHGALAVVRCCYCSVMCITVGLIFAEFVRG